LSSLWLERGAVADAPAVAALEAACFSHPWTEEQICQELVYGPPGAVLVLWAADDAAPRRRRLAAYCAYRLVLDEMHVMDVAVSPSWRRRGLATWLLRLSLRRATLDGARRAVLEVRAGNEAARALYARLGFEAVGRRRDYYREPPEDAAVLVLDPMPGTEP